MKISLALVLFFTCSLCVAQQTPKASDFKKLSWIEGGWNRTNVKPNRSTREYWKKNSPVSYQGRGVNLNGSDTTFVEKLKIITRNDSIFYVADIPENNGEVFFYFTRITDKGFSCENPKHDFPKKIEYWLEGEKLKATISGDGKVIDYWFERVR